MNIIFGNIRIPEDILQAISRAEEELKKLNRYQKDAE
jgi:hypothetical protein